MTLTGSTFLQNSINLPDKTLHGENSSHLELRKARESLFSGFSSGKINEDFQSSYSKIIDRYFITAVHESKTGHELFKKKIPFTLVAVGGYGREELCMFSDIDILVLFSDRIPSEAQKLSEELFYPLWDLGLELGYGVRTIRDCLKLGKDDFMVLASMLDARFLCGNADLYTNLAANFQKKVTERYSQKFINSLEEQSGSRMSIFGAATHLLEPDLKEGTGGLRDYHHILWAAKAFNPLNGIDKSEHPEVLSIKEYAALMKEAKFILLVRNHLHELSKRKNDRLNFEYQEDIARRLGFKKLDRIQPVEQFLGRLYSAMEEIKILHRSFFRSLALRKENRKKPETRHLTEDILILDDELSFPFAFDPKKNHLIIMKIFVESARYGIPLSLEAMRLVRESLPFIDDQFRNSSWMFKDLLAIINSDNAINTFKQMFETSFLDACIPEFSHIRNRVQFDAYHIFPVGRHMLETFYRLKNLPAEKNTLLRTIFFDQKDREALFLASLFHDIGKTGKNHSKRGVRIMENIFSRFSYSGEKADEVLFLIENHLFLAETATRRDLNDEKTIINAARKIGSVNNLNSLYLLTWADSMATGPRAWNEWISNLVQELYFKILHILETGELATPDVSHKVSRLKKQLRKLTLDIIDREEFENFLEIMPSRYKLITPAPDMVSHYGMITELKEKIKDKQPQPFVFRCSENKEAGCWKVTFAAEDRPGLFSDIAGVMALNNINILASNIYTWRDGTAVDVFSVTRPLDTINPEETWDRVTRDLENTFSGKLALSYRLSKKKTPIIRSSSRSPSLPPGVSIDNKSSDFFTIIETFASDKVGLLHMITRTLFELRLDIRIAMTGVKGDQTADVFYVRDFYGQKLEDNAQVNEIKMALLHQLQSDPV